MKNSEIKSLANRNSKIVYLSIFNYLRFSVGLKKEDIEMEMYEYCDWLQAEYCKEIDLRKDKSSKMELEFLEYCQEFFDMMVETIETANIIKSMEE